MAETQPRKRPRPVISCLRCREKKLKCDRLSPCENCTKAGCPADCMYHQVASVSDSLAQARGIQLSGDSTIEQPLHYRNGTGKGAGGVGVVEDLQQRVTRLEELLAVRSSASNLTQIKEAHPAFGSSPQSSTASTQGATLPSFLGALVVKGPRTRYHGQNDRVTLLNQFAEAKNFIYQCAKDDTIVALAKEVQLLQRKSQKSAKSPQPPRESDSSPALLKLREFLPLKVDCDRLVDIYTKNFEKTLRILHVPTFLHSYREFWVTTDRDISKMATFLPQLTAVLTLSLALEGRNAFFDDPSARTYLELAALDHITAWLEELDRKQRVNIATLQVETLTLLTATGALVRSAMSMGLHLNPTQSNEISAFQAELRRRLWITIVEMDLQASMASGMPVMVPDVDFSPMTPANLNDLDFDESISELPISRPLHEWTDSLPQVSLAMGLSHRIKVMTLVKNVVPEMDLTEVVKQGRKLEEALQQIPTCLKCNYVLENHKSPADLLNSVLLDIYTRRPLLCLYRPMLLRDTRDDPSFFEIQRACLESSLVILSYQDYFDPRATDPDALSSNSYWDIFQTHCKNDILWAALCICQYIRSSSRQSTSNAPPDASRPYPPQWSLPHSKVSLIRIVENTLDILIQRIGKIGSDLKGILVLSVVLQSIQARGSTQEKESLMYQGMKKALSACRQNLFPAVAPWNQHTPTLNMPDVPQMHPSTHLTSIPSSEPHLTPNAELQGLQQQEFPAQSSAWATELSHFQGDIFPFGNGTFNIDNDWNFDQFWQ
ncbi:hypothetical protein Egran_02591 [Elaphomyces granulatus]|uniref:Zn(2)-C6 fungal-type domain-containing protein n=1 Tax=Elaphomyces granulatus TaxID=519963 RepID=A0A232LZW4_9EURO|nr:hypothetical protein Egran_02591 [Elaphomyces granulatus]